MKASKIEDFMKANENSAVVYGELLTPEGNPLNNGEDIGRSDRTLYRLDDGRQFVVLHSDRTKENMPRWAGGE